MIPVLAFAICVLSLTAALVLEAERLFHAPIGPLFRVKPGAPVWRAR